MKCQKIYALRAMSNTLALHGKSMPLESQGAAARIKRIRQRIEAASPLPQGAAASDAISSEEGRIWRSVDGCCVLPSPLEIFVRFVGFMGDGLRPCTNYNFNPAPVLAGTVITVENATGGAVEWNLGNGDPSDPAGYQAAYSTTVAAGEITSYTVPSGAVILNMFFKSPSVDCPKVPPTPSG